MKLLGILLASLAVAGCIPPYIEDLDKAAAMTRQMTLVGTVGPLSSGNSGQGAIRFLPAKPTVSTIDALNVTSGFLVTETADTDSLQFMYTDSSGKAQTTGGQPLGLAGADPNYPFYDFDVTATTTTANIVVVNLVPTNPPANQAILFTATLPSGPLTPSSPMPLNTVFAAPLITVLGVQVAPLMGGPDVFNFLLWNGGSGFGEGFTGVGGTVFTPPGTQVAEPLLTVALRRVLYYRNASGTLSYASYFLAGSGWVCDQWTSSPSTAPVRLAGVTNRIDAVLTSGDLLSTEGGTLRLYDPSGSMVKSVSLGGLQFCYEAFIGTTPYVFFSLTMDLGRGHWAFRTYAVPTSAMRGLS